MNYQVADFIIQIKNAYLANRKIVAVPYSNITKSIGQLLVKKQLLSEIKEDDLDGKRILVVSLRYSRRKPAFTNVEIISKPSLRIYKGIDQIKNHIRDKSLVVISTSKGIMTAEDAISNKNGGELLFKIK